MKANKECASTVVDFGSTLSHDLVNASSTSNVLTPASLDRHIEYALSLPLSSLELQVRIKLDALGTKLWNICTRILRNGEREGEGEKLISHGLLRSNPLSLRT